MSCYSPDSTLTVNSLFLPDSSSRRFDDLVGSSGLALLSIAKTVADFFVLYVSPHKLDYRLFVMDHTPDFGPDSEEEKQLLEKVLWRKRRKKSLLIKHARDPEGQSSAHLLSGISERISEGADRESGRESGRSPKFVPPSLDGRPESIDSRLSAPTSV